MMTFAPGEAVTFVLRNTDPIDHEFILADEAVQMRHENGTEAHHDEVATEVSVVAGSTKRTTVKFGKAGELIVGCHLPGHYNYGMKAFVRIAS